MYVYVIDADIWAALQKRFLPRLAGSGMGDIYRYDGEGYRRHLHFLSQPANVSLLLNTDGVAIYRSSKVSIWPVWAVVNELPVSMRSVTLHHWSAL